MKDKGSETIASRISRILAKRIVSGEIRPGTPLRQDHIAEEFDTSHVPVREAFRLLESQGLAVSQPRRGFRVAPFDPDEVREVAEMRAALEALALHHAAPHLTKAILDQAEEAIRDGDKSNDVQSWEDANRTFHRLILEPCSMPRLLASIDDLHAVSARFLFASRRLPWVKPTDNEHRIILDALRKGQVDTAASTLARHVRQIGRMPRHKPADNE